MENEAPGTIYLQWCEFGNQGITWCHEKINGDDIKYVRHNSHNTMISLIANYLQIDRHELGNLLQEMQAKAMIERGEMDDLITQDIEDDLSSCACGDVGCSWCL